MKEKILEVKNLEVSFKTYAGISHAVRGIDFNLHKGETLAIVGESGCGKTVSSKAIMRLLPESNTIIGENSEVLFHGEDLLKKSENEMVSIRGSKISMIFQDPMTSLNPTMKIGDQIAESILIHRQISKEEAYKEALEMLQLVKIPNAEKRMKQYPFEFSGGMRQRAMIAIALACKPEILIADEPTTALDVTIQAQIMELIGELQKELDMAMILVTHDLGVVASVADKIQVMYAGKIVERGDVREIFYQSTHPYTRALLDSVPKIHSTNKETLYSLKGTPPDLINPPVGCSFAPRCEYGMNICRKKYPELTKFSDTQECNCWYEKLGSDYATSETKTVFNGPFKIESWSQNTEMVLVRNDQYWGADDVKLDKINSKIIQESGTAVQSYINGELDVIGTTDANWGKTIEEQGESESYQVPDSAPEFFMLNAANEYLCNEKIRQALSVAYDRQEMIDTLRNGKGVPIYSMMPDTIQVGEKTYTELVGGKNHFVQELQDEIKDPKALLIEGLKELGKDPDPSKVTIRYASRGTSEVSKKIAEWMKQQWESVLGINIEIDMMEWNIMWDKIDAGDYDIATGGWGPYYNEPSALLQLFDPDNGYFNAEKTGWSGEDPKKYQELLNEAKFEVDDQKKAELYLQAEELVVKSGLIEPTYVEEAPTFVKKYVKNYFVSTVGQVDFSKVYIEK